MGEARKAIEYYDQHLEIAREIGDRRGEGNALDNLGSIYAALGEVRQAIKLMEAALKIFEQIESPDIESPRKILAELRITDNGS